MARLIKTSTIEEAIKKSQPKAEKNTLPLFSKLTEEEVRSVLIGLGLIRSWIQGDAITKKIELSVVSFGNYAPDVSTSIDYKKLVITLRILNKCFKHTIKTLYRVMEAKEEIDTPKARLNPGTFFISNWGTTSKKAEDAYNELYFFNEEGKYYTISYKMPKENIMISFLELKRVLAMFKNENEISRTLNYYFPGHDMSLIKIGIERDIYHLKWMLSKFKNDSQYVCYLPHAIVVNVEKEFKNIKRLG